MTGFWCCMGHKGCFIIECHHFTYDETKAQERYMSSSAITYFMSGRGSEGTGLGLTRRLRNTDAGVSLEH